MKVGVGVVNNNVNLDLCSGNHAMLYLKIKENEWAFCGKPIGLTSSNADY